MENLLTNPYKQTQYRTAQNQRLNYTGLL